MVVAAAAAGKKGSRMEMMIKRRGCAPAPSRPSAAAAARRPGAGAVRSVTRDEIDTFWRRKRMEEEDHLLAALKAAARIRARNLKEEDYREFEASLESILRCGGGGGGGASEKDAGSCEDGGVAGSKEELRAVMRDWWTKSKYAYLNQPALLSMEPEAAAAAPAAKRTATNFSPNACFFPVAAAKPCSAALGVF